VGGVDRRRFLQAAGISLVASAGLVACESPRAGGSNAVTPTLETSTTVVSPDVGILRLASSLEHYAVGLYQTAAGSGLMRTPAIAEVAKYFADQHADHAKTAENLTSGAGGPPFTTANPAVAAMLRPRVDALRSEADVVKLVYDVEAVVAATYFSAIGSFDDNKLDAVAVSIQGIEARHVAVLGMILSGLPLPLGGIARRTDSSPYSTAGFQTGDGAVAFGTGV
jgi:hypothetical protein